jgi:hypothetical protein
MVVALCGLANLAIPFRFLGVHKRVTGALILVGGVALTLGALYWPASMIRVAQPRTHLDEIMPEYRFSEKHSTRVHARPEQVMEGIRQATFRDMTSLVTLMRIRGAVLRTPKSNLDKIQDKRILDSFSEAGYIPGGGEREIAMFGAWNAKKQRRPAVRTLQEFADCREQGVVKMAFDFAVEEAGDGWSTITAETRVAIPGDAGHGMATYWRLIVPGSGLLRLQWLDGIKRRAESMPAARS